MSAAVIFVGTNLLTTAGSTRGIVVLPFSATSRPSIHVRSTLKSFSESTSMKSAGSPTRSWPTSSL